MRQAVSSQAHNTLSPNKARRVSLYGSLGNEQEPYKKRTNSEAVVIEGSSSTGENEVSAPNSINFETASYIFVTDESTLNTRYKQGAEEVF